MACCWSVLGERSPPWSSMVVRLVTHTRTPVRDVCDYQFGLGAELQSELRNWSDWVRVDTGINDAGG